jgi:EmrB/QacA subfamily drug resistance transporter
VTALGEPLSGRARSTGGRSTGVVVAVSLALFCVNTDFFALNLALPTIGRAFGVGARSVQWTISAYMLSVGSLFILAGRIGDIFGRRPSLLAGIGIFGGASLVCAAAPSLGVLIAARVLQGAGAAIIYPVGVAVVSNAVSEQRRARALGVTFGFANLGTAVGPFVGGVLTNSLGWRWVFWALALTSAAAFAVTLLVVPNSSERDAPRRLDVIGAATVVAGVALLSVTIDRGQSWGWGSARTIIALVISGSLLVLFLFVETRVRFPLLDLKLFRNLPYDLVTAMGAVANVVYVTTAFAVTLYLQQVRGLTPFVAGVVFLAPSLLASLSGPISGRIGKFARPTAVMAAAGLVSGVGVLAMTIAHGWPAFIVCFAFAGLGFGLGWTFASVGTQDVVSPERAGEASGVLLTILVTAGGIGIAVAATVIEALVRSGTSSADAIHGTMRALGIGIIVAAAAVMAIRHHLVRRGLMAPLSMKEAQPPSPDQATALDAARPTS